MRNLARSSQLDEPLSSNVRPAVERIQLRYDPQSAASSDTEGRLANVFISYARKDRAIVERLAAALEAQGFSVWWDRRIVGGADFAKDIERQLNAAEAVVVAWSTHGNESPWVRDEATRAQRLDKLVPILLDKTEAPMGFGQYQAIDFSSWRGDSEAPELEDLLRTLRVRVSGETGPSVSGPRMALTKRPLRPLPIAAAGAIVLVIVVALVVQRGWFPGSRSQDPAQAAAAPAADQIDPASIAVLPFADLSAANDQQYISDGIAEEILNVLANIEGLKVASRTSSFQFRNPQTGVPAIARELGVRHILEGSVRKSGETIRITVQLIDAKSDRHLWSSTYDRPLTTENIFAIQDEIASAIVSELAAKISVAANTISVVADTSNFAAYELYLHGRALFAARGPENLAAAARALEKAVDLDPAFARAWETLAMVYGVSESWDVTDRDYQRLAIDAADRAERLNPGLSTPYAVRGSVIFDMIGTGESDDWEASLANLDEAIARDPKNATAWLWRGLDLFALGYFDRAIADLERCLELDPAYGYCAKWLAYAELVTGREDKALRRYQSNRQAAFSPEPVFAAAYVARGDRPAAQAVLTDFYSGTPQVGSAVYRALTDPSFSAADRAEALALIRRLPPSIGETAARLFLGDYSDAVASINSVLWWYRGDGRYLKSAERKKHMRRFYLPEYWRAHGFPPQCRPVGAVDFECD